jgi:hypothetical protein
MDAFTVRIQYTPEDLQRAYRIHNSKVYPVGSRLLLFLGLISLIIGGVLMLYSCFALKFTNWFAWFLIIYGIFIIGFYFWRIKTMGRRMFSKMPDFTHPYEYTFSEIGIKASSVFVNSDNLWNYYIRYCITPDMILLYPNKFRFNFFARKHFTEEQFKQLQAWIIENVPDTFKKKQK